MIPQTQKEVQKGPSEIEEGCHDKPSHVPEGVGHAADHKADQQKQSVKSMFKEIHVGKGRFYRHDLRPEEDPITLGHRQIQRQQDNQSSCVL